MGGRLSVIHLPLPKQWLVNLSAISTGTKTMVGSLSVTSAGTKTMGGKLSVIHLPLPKPWLVNLSAISTGTKAMVGSLSVTSSGTEAPWLVTYLPYPNNGW